MVDVTACAKSMVLLNLWNSHLEYGATDSERHDSDPWPDNTLFRVALLVYPGELSLHVFQNGSLFWDACLELSLSILGCMDAAENM